VKGVLAWLVAGMAALLFLSPLLWMLLASVQPSGSTFGGLIALLDTRTMNLQNYVDAYRRANLGTALLMSTLQIIAIVTGGLFINSAAAYVFARLSFPGREALFACITAFMILPLEALVIPLLLCTRDLGLTAGHAATLAGLSLPFVAKAFNVYLLRQHFLLVPRELEEAGALDGASVFIQYFRIALPLVKPGLIAAALIDVLTHWGDFLWPLMISTRSDTRTVQLGLANLFTEPPLDWGAIMACAVMTTIPILLLFRWLARYLVENDLRVGLR